MKLPSLSHVVPEEYLAPVAVSELLEKIKSELASTTDKLARLEALTEQMRELFSANSAGDMVTQVKTTIGDALSLLNENKQSKIRNSDEYKSIDQLLNTLSVATQPIGLQSNSIEKDIAFSPSRTFTQSEGELTLSVAANCKYALTVMSDADAESALAELVANQDIILNQDISAGFALGASAKAQIHAISLGASASKTGGVEIDTYFQVPSQTPTALALWKMYSRLIKPWDINSMVRHLVPMQISGHAQGYRAVHLRTQGELAIEGSVGVGHSLVFSKTSADADIDIDLTAAASFSRRLSLTGNMLTKISKNANGKLLLAVSLEDNRSDTDTFALSLQSQISGLDQLARNTLKRFFNDADELIDLLEQCQHPGQLFQEKLAGELKTTSTFYKELAFLTLGERTTDKVINTLLLDALQEKFDTTPFSFNNQQQSSAMQAASLLDKLLAQFDINLDSLAIDQSAITRARSEVEAKLVRVIDKVKTGIKGKAEIFKNKIQQALAQGLEPLSALGHEVRNALDTLDDNTQEKVQLVVSKYAAFKKRIEDALDKAAKIKLGFELVAEAHESDTELLSFCVEIDDPDNALVRHFFRAIVIGDQAKASRLLHTLDGNGLNIVDKGSHKLSWLRKTETALSINILGLNLNTLKNVEKDLVVSVDPQGQLFIKHQYSVNASAQGFDELRSAVFNLSYGVAQAAYLPSKSASIGLSYINQDSNVHSRQEMRDFLNSFDINPLLTRHEAPISVAPLVSHERVQVAMTKYETVIADPVFKGGESCIHITMAPGNNTYQALMKITPRHVGNLAVPMLLYMQKNTALRKLTLQCAQLYVDAGRINEWYGLIEHVLGDANDISARTLKNDLRNVDGYDQTLARLKTSSRSVSEPPDWKKVARTLSQCLQTARAASRLPTILQDIDKTVAGYRNIDLNHNDLARLSSELRALNEKVEGELDKWIEVDGPLANAVKDWFSKFGLAQAGINARLLCFMLLLRDRLNLGENAFVISITVNSKLKDKTKTIIL